MEIKDICELDKTDKERLVDFWRYCNSLDKYMAFRCKVEEDCLHLPNRMICYAFAAMEWKEHCRRFEERKAAVEDLWKKRNELFMKEHGFDFFIETMADPSARIKYLKPGIKKALSSAGIITYEDLVNSSVEDICKIKGLGPKKAKEVEFEREGVRACMEFKKNHPELFAEEEGDAE